MIRVGLVRSGVRHGKFPMWQQLYTTKADGDADVLYREPIRAYFAVSCKVELATWHELLQQQLLISAAEPSV